MAPPESQAINRSRATFLAAAVGDALGWPMEDRGNRVGGTANVRPAPRLVAWRRREGGRFAPHEEEVAAGTYSDDTQLLLAVGRARLRGQDWHRHLIEAELPLWPLYERGGGGALKRSARSWAMGRAPWDLGQKPEAVLRYFNAGGNGAAMRCIPHVLFDREARRFEQISECLDADALATHGHPRALVGARALAWGTWWALGRTSSLSYGELLERSISAAPEWARPPRPDGSWMESMRKNAPEWRQEWDRAVREMLDFLSLARQSLRHGAVALDAETLEGIGVYGKERGAGTVSAAAALFLASRYTSQPLQGLLAAAFLRNTDSDTIASMTGALLGALAGDDWLGELPRQLQDSRYVHAMADWLANGEGPEIESFKWQAAVRTGLYRRLESAAPGDQLELPIFGPAAISEIEDYRTKSRSFIRSWKIETSSGQTLMIKRTDKGKDGRPRWVGNYLRLNSASDRKTTSPPPVPPIRRRAGLVRIVADLDTAVRFYEEFVGLKRERASKNFVSFGWLALEQPRDGRVEQLPLPNRDELESSRQAIRIYVDEKDIPRRHREISASGLQVGSIQKDEHCSRFRCSDPDGYVIEFRGYESR